jgi:hypothetical protein
MYADTIILAVIRKKLGLPESCAARRILCAIDDLQDKVAGDVLEIKKPYLLTWTPGESGGEITDANGDEYFFKKPNAVEMAKDILATPIIPTLPKQEPLGEEFAKGLYENLDSLYESEPTQPAPAN